MRVPFVGGSNQSRTVNVSAQQTINLVPELDPEGKFLAALYGRPCLSLFAAGGAAPVRGMWAFGSLLVAVVGADVKTISTTGTVTRLGSLNTNSGRVIAAANPTQLMLVDGADGWIVTSTLAQITDAQFPSGATHVAFLDGYFIVNSGNQIAISALNDGTNWASTDVATVERDPDDVLAVIVDHREVWLPGEKSTEVWQNTGNPDFPLEPIASAFTEWGIAAAFSITKIDGSVYWLAKGPDGAGVFMKSQGFRASRISTHAIEERVGKMATTSDCFAYAIQSRGHVFVVWTFPTEDWTVVYDAATNLWTEWKSFGIGRFRANCHAFFNGKHYVGDYQDGNIFALDWETYSDNGGAVEYVRRDRHVVDQQSRGRVFHRSLELEFAAGTGSASVDPQAMLRFSDDGGHTWSNELWRGIGYVGQYRRRSRWHRLGASRDRVYEVKLAARHKVALVGGYTEVSVGS